MGCKASKEAHVAELRVDDAHARRRRAQTKHLAGDFDLTEVPPPPLKLGVRQGLVAGDAAASRTPAVTPQAEVGRCAEPRKTSAAPGTRRPVDNNYSSSDSDAQQTGRASPSVPSCCAQRGLHGLRVTTKKASCEDIDEGGAGKNGSEEPEWCRTACGVENAEGTHANLQEQRQQQRQPGHKPPEEASGAAWPTPPPVLLVLHLFLENNRPPPSKNKSRPPRRVRFPGGLAYEGQLCRHKSKHDEQEQQQERDQDQDQDQVQGREEEEEQEEEVVPHGWGRMVFPDGAFYEGAWRGGVVYGKGALHLANGNCYFGSWGRGRKHGLGTYMYADGSCHEGFYSKGERGGVGTMHYASGAVYEGEFKSGRRHGVGRLELAAEGASYDGDWVDDVPHGHGIHVDPAGGGERFEGRWRHGIRSGGGTLVQGWAEKGEHEGEQEGEKEEEEGKGDVGVVSSEVAWYSGNFSRGYPHGDGMMVYRSMTYWGHVDRGVWNGGGRIDLGEPGLGSYEGSWVDGIPRGSGRWQSKQSQLEVDCTFEQGYSGQIWPK